MFSTVRSISFAGLVITSLLGASAGWADETTTKTTTNEAVNTEGDNSKTNVRDRDTTQATADRQTSHRADVETIRKIRSAIVSDKSLSTYAHNVKIISQNDGVVLKGPVRSETERLRLEVIATQNAGQIPVRNELEITPK